jgi:nitroreductase
LNTLKEAIRLSSSSYGLQPYQIIIVENPELRARIQPASWGQSQVVDASHLIVFANETAVSEEKIEHYLDLICQKRNLPPGSMKGYGDYMKSVLLKLSPEEFKIWTSKQTYLALGNLLNAAAELKIDTTPMEGFVPEQLNEILGLDKLGLNASLLATIGYRHQEDSNQFNAKVRKSNEELFITL